MCLIVFAWRCHADYELVLAANRDEFFSRPTAAAGFWAEAPHILAGRDLLKGGTWLGVTRSGRWGALTNVRAAAPTAAAGRSRGLLVSTFLRGTQSPAAYLARVARWGHRFAGFNLLAGDRSTLAWYSNRSAAWRPLEPGLYGLSNHLLDTPWPKVRRAKARLGALLARPDVAPEQLWELLADRELPPGELPATGLDPALERALGSIFVAAPGYGTRCSTLLLMGRDGTLRLGERRFAPDGRLLREAWFDAAAAP